jgi:hypothetical protein
MGVSAATHIDDRDTPHWLLAPRSSDAMIMMNEDRCRLTDHGSDGVCGGAVRVGQWAAVGITPVLEYPGALPTDVDGIDFDACSANVPLRFWATTTARATTLPQPLTYNRKIGRQACLDNLCA